MKIQYKRNETPYKDLKSLRDDTVDNEDGEIVLLRTESGETVINGSYPIDQIWKELQELERFYARIFDQLGLPW